MATADWIKEAEEQAKKYSDSIRTSNQYLIDQLNKARDNSLAQLEQQQNSALENLQRQQDNALYNLNAQKSDIYRTANDNAQQLNINRLLNLRDNQYAMNRAGLGSQGIVGSQVNSINNNYGRNLTDVLNQRVKDLNALALQRENTNLGYDTNRINLGNVYNTNRLNLENEYGNNIANLQREIEAQALNQYNNIYNNYLALKQNEAELALRQAAQDEAKRQWQLEYDLAKKKSSSSSSGGSSSTKKVTVNSSPTQQFSDNKNQTNNNTFDTSKLKNAGKVNTVYGKLPSTIDGNSQIKTDGKKYYVVDKNNNYIDITNGYNTSKNKHMTLTWGSL